MKKLACPQIPNSSLDNGIGEKSHHAAASLEGMQGKKLACPQVLKAIQNRCRNPLPVFFDIWEKQEKEDGDRPEWLFLVIWYLVR